MSRAANLEGSWLHTVISLEKKAVLVCYGSHKKIPWTVWLKQQKFIFHSSGNKKSKINQGVHRSDFSCHLPLACRWPLS